MTESSRRSTVVVLFAVYLVLLAWAVLWKLHLPFVGTEEMRGIKLVPFVSGGGFGRSAPREVLANLLIFVPFGVYVAVLARSWSWWMVTALAALASLVLESAQFVLASGSTDLTDVIVNTAGGLVGFVVVAAVGRRLRSPAVTGILAAGTVLALLGSAVVIASFPRLEPPSEAEDVFILGGEPSP